MCVCVHGGFSFFFPCFSVKSKDFVPCKVQNRKSSYVCSMGVHRVTSSCSCEPQTKNSSIPCIRNGDGCGTGKMGGTGGLQLCDPTLAPGAWNREVMSQMFASERLQEKKL